MFLYVGKMKSVRSAGFFLSIFFMGVALIATFWLPTDILDYQIQDRLQAPNSVHFLGTDHLGRDILSMLMAGTTNSLGIAIVAVLLGSSIGFFLALLVWVLQISWLNRTIFYLSDSLLAFPVLLTALILATFYRPGLLNVIIAIALYNIPIFIRLTDTTLRAISKNSYIKAAFAMGQTRSGMLWKHMIHSLAAIGVVQITVQISFALLAEAGLSYLGFGITYPQTSWGKMLFDGQTFIEDYPWLVIWPGLCMTLAVLGFQLLGEWLRKNLDIPS